MSASIHRFTLGGTLDTALGVVLLAGTDDPILPRTRDRYVEVPGVHGRHAFQSDLGPREFGLRLAVVNGTSPETLQALTRAFAEILLDQDGHPEDVSLVFTKEATKTYTVRYSGNLPIARLIGNSLGEFVLPLIASDPYAYGAAEGASASITAAYQEVPLSNTGDYRTPPVMTFTNNGMGNVTGFTLILRQLK